MSDSLRLAECYQRDGFVSRVEVFSQTKIEESRQQFDALEGREGREKCQIGLQQWHLKEEFIWNLATDARVLDIMEQLMGHDILLLSTHFFCKYPVDQVEHFVAWHQDVTYWGLEPQEAHSAWIAIDNASTENGCMRVIPGSHKEGLVPHDKSQSGGNLLSINQEIPDKYVDQSKIVPLELTAGQLSVHHGCLFHASHPNLSQRRRCGLVVRFVPTHVKQVERNSTGKMWPGHLVRGRDDFKHFQEQAPPFALA